MFSVELENDAGLSKICFHKLIGEGVVDNAVADCCILDWFENSASLRVIKDAVLACKVVGVGNGPGGGKNEHT